MCSADPVLNQQIPRRSLLRPKEVGFSRFSLNQVRSFRRTQGEKLLHALNKNSGEVLLVARSKKCPKQNDHNRQRKPCWRH
jgi:hypothetical protein